MGGVFFGDFDGVLKTLRVKFFKFVVIVVEGGVGFDGQGRGETGGASTNSLGNVGDHFGDIKIIVLVGGAVGRVNRDNDHGDNNDDRNNNQTKKS